MATKSRNFVFVLVWFALLISAGIHLFSKGFLLTRVAQTNVSSCISYSEYRCESDGKNGSTQKSECSGAEKVSSILQDIDVASGICFPPKARVILLVIDALRYDFGLFNPDNAHPEPYENNLPIMSELLRKYPEHSRRLKFVADPPTTTMQRLKGMTTGSLPTFIDIGSNFASPEINEDNLVDQLARANRTTVFLGDGTWTELFPNRFTREYPFPSFNIYDLDTVDGAIERQLPREMARGDWDLIVAHFLGVDHCGHRYGPGHDEMRRKLREMNDVIRNVTERMADGTTLLVVGDHGMTKTGDHGGETDDEVEALLFAYTKGAALLPRAYDAHADTMQQIDLVPTLAAMLGVPVPYSNLGQIVFQLLPDVRLDTFMRHQLALVHLWQNARQVQNYYQQYGEPRTDDGGGEQEPDQEQDDADNAYLMLTQRVNSIYTEAAFQSFSGDLRHYLRGILDGYRRVWVKFDPQLISHGLLITFLGCFAMALLIVNASPHQLATMFTEGATTYAFLLVFFAAQTGYAFHELFGLSSAAHGVILFGSVASVALLALLAARHWVSISENMSTWRRRSANVLTRVSFVFTTCVFFANSFIVQEQKILSYVLMGFFLAGLYQLQRVGGTRFALPRMRWVSVKKSMLVKLVALTLFALALIRLSGGYFRCREEQANCTDHLVKAPSVSSPSERGRGRGFNSDLDLVPCVALVVYVVCTRLYLRACGNLTGTSVNVLLARYGPTVAVVCTCAHFTVSKTSAQGGIPQLHVDAQAWVVYGLLLLQILVLLGTPLLLYVLPKRTDVLNVLYGGERSNVAPEIYRQLKANYDGSRTGDPAAAVEIPIVCGLGTAYSSAFIAAGAFLTVTLSLLLGSHGTMGLIIVNGVAVAYGIIASILQYEQSATSLAACIQPSFPTLLTWVILQQYGFFATAHQPTLSQIDWNAAFIGRTYYFDGSNILSGTLVLLNTFSVTFLLSVMFPLLIFVPFCVYTMWPTLAQRPSSSSSTTTAKTPPSQSARASKAETLRKITSDGGSVEYRSVTVNKAGDETGDGTNAPDFDITKGELNLYENEKLFLGTAFKTACQLILLQSLRIFCAMFACTLHCRHLMVWKIFAPRFIYEGIASYVMFVGVILGFLLLLRVHRSVSALITAINKRR